MASDVPFAEFPKMGVLIKGRFNAKQQTIMVFHWALQGIKYFPPRYNQIFFGAKSIVKNPRWKFCYFVLKKLQTKFFWKKITKLGSKKNPTPGYAPPFSGTSPGPQVSLMGGVMKGGMVCIKKETGSSPSIIFFEFQSCCHITRFGTTTTSWL